MYNTQKSIEIIKELINQYGFGKDKVVSSLKSEFLYQDQEAERAWQKYEEKLKQK